MSKPIVYPRFAINDLVDGTSGKDNVSEPSQGQKDSGWNRHQKPPRQTFNWLHRITNDWIEWFDSLLDQGVNIADSPTFADLTIGSTAIGDMINASTGTTENLWKLDSDAGTFTIIKNDSGSLRIRNQLDNDDASLIVKNLTVNGTTTTIESETVTIADNIMLLNSDVTGTPSEDAGIEIERGDSTNASLIWDEGSDVWKAGLASSEVQLADINYAGVWDVNGSDIYYNSGNVGIGITTSLDGTLHVHTATAGVVTADASADDLVVENSTSAGISILGANASPSQLVFGSPSDAFGAFLQYIPDDNIYKLGTHNADDYIVFSTGSNSEKMRINSDGKVGIGITTAPDGTLHVHSATAGAVTATGDANDLIVENSDHSGMTFLCPDNKLSNIYFGTVSDVAGAIIRWDYANSLMSIGTDKDSSDLAFVAGGFAEKMRVNSDGKVGIGITTAPDGLLHVHTATAGAVAADSNADELVLENSGNCGLSILSPNANLSLIYFGSTSDNIGAWIEWNYTNDLMTISTAKTSADLSFGADNGSEKMRINSDGKVGIGITTAPDGLLHVHNGTAGSVTANVIADSLVVEDSGNGGISILTPDANQGSLTFGSPTDEIGASINWKHSLLRMIVGTHYTGSFLVFNSDNAVERMRINSDGKVGIGITTAPDGTLHVHTATAGAVSASADADELVLENSGNTGLSILSPDASSSNLFFGSVTDSVGAFVNWGYSSLLMQVGTSVASAEISILSGNQVEAIRIDDSQNVGINEDSPSEKLDVVGNVKVTGDIYSTAWTDYSSTSTIVGWSSFTEKEIFYKTIGKLVYVQFNIRGTSNATTVTFTLPFNQNSDIHLSTICGETVNDTTKDYGNLTVSVSGNIVYVYPSTSGSAWTTSVTKKIHGQFWYEKA